MPVQERRTPLQLRQLRLIESAPHARAEWTSVPKNILSPEGGRQCAGSPRKSQPPGTTCHPHRTVGGTRKDMGCGVRHWSESQLCPSQLSARGPVLCPHLHLLLHKMGRVDVHFTEATAWGRHVFQPDSRHLRPPELSPVLGSSWSADREQQPPAARGGATLATAPAGTASEGSP